MKNKIFSAVMIFIVFYGYKLDSQELYKTPSNTKTRWASFENPGAEKGAGGKENKKAKGHAFDNIKAGESKVLLSAKGTGIINRIWLTINDRSPKILRSLKIEMFWDNSEKPAVSAPLGDFFGIGLGRKTAFENELFADPEGRSFICHIPMPFKTSAKIVITNESEKDLKYLFYDINFLLTDKWDPKSLYFHCYWNRDKKTELGKDFEILPKVNGKGRYLGTNIGVKADSIYEYSWWGEGEVKTYLDGDSDYPTLVGTGTEDYIGTGWGQGKYSNRYSGCLIADTARKEWAFYRYHIPDPVYFDQDCRVTIQQIGGDSKSKVMSLIEKGVPLIPVSIDANPFLKLLELSPTPDLKDKNVPSGWTNFYRQDDFSATAYFYLNKPVNNLPELISVKKRIAGL
jgi:hypothetical protein